jgi:hypothetical protein
LSLTVNPAATPEPSSVALALLGLAPFGLARLRSSHRPRLLAATEPAADFT